MFIDGKWAKPSTDAMIEIVTPATEEVGFRVAEAKEADVDAAVTAARKAFDDGPWPRMTHLERAGYLRAIGLKIRDRVENMAQAFPMKRASDFSSTFTRRRKTGWGWDWPLCDPLSKHMAERSPQGMPRAAARVLNLRSPRVRIAGVNAAPPECRRTKVR